MNISTLRSDLEVFFSRNTKQPPGEFLVEKQEAEQGSMSTIADEASTYGYLAEDRHMVSSFIQGREPSETRRDGLSYLELIMACYMSAETGRRLKFPPSGLEHYIPQSVRADWNPNPVLDGL
jgi:predicted dehydrogenase